jgi:hypothetical protein
MNVTIFGVEQGLFFLPKMVLNMLSKHPLFMLELLELLGQMVEL